MKRLTIAPLLLAALASAVVLLAGPGAEASTAGTSPQVSAGGWHTCGVKTDGTVACWGWDYYGQASPPAGTFSQVSVGGWHTCGVKRDGTLACWGDDTYGQATPPTPPLPVGGIALLPDASGSSAPGYIALAALAATALVALTAGAWYARRRWLG
jgi:hypothetical protein